MTAGLISKTGALTSISGIERTTGATAEFVPVAGGRFAATTGFGLGVGVEATGGLEMARGASAELSAVTGGGFCAASAANACRTVVSVEICAVAGG